MRYEIYYNTGNDLETSFLRQDVFELVVCNRSRDAFVIADPTQHNSSLSATQLFTPAVALFCFSAAFLPSSSPGFRTNIEYS